MNANEVVGELRVFCFLVFLGFCSVSVAQTDGPPVRTPSYQRGVQGGVPQYPWHLRTTATIFWIGEKPTQGNPTPNNMSSWDTKWQQNYGGFDNPNARNGYLPKGFVPKLNPFYVALPYNDVQKGSKHKPEAARVIPWFKRYNPRPGQTVCRGRWVEIVRNDKTCFAQWEDCGPFQTDDWEFVFKNKAPQNRKNRGAGIDLSPAVRDFLGIKSGQKVHWRFVEFANVKRGPWALHGTNNPFVNPKARR